MSHIDEGRLHAYLDGGLPDGARELRAVEDHLRVCADCRARLEAARSRRERAGEILSLLAPDEVAVPPFEELERRRKKGGGRSTGGTWMRLGWAASVVLALGVGWMARDAGLISDGPGSAEPEAARLEAVRSAPPVAAAGEEERVGAGVESRAESLAEPPAETVQAGAEPESDPEPARVAGAAADVADVAGVEAASAAPSPDAEVAGDVEELEARADAAGAWRQTTPAAAAAALGRSPLELEGLPWERMEVARVGDRVLVRTMHPVERGRTVALVQAAEATEEALAPTDAPAAAPLPLPDADPGASRFRAAPAPGPEREEVAEPAPDDVPPAVVGARVEGVALLLRGQGEPAELERLLGRVR